VPLVINISTSLITIKYSYLQGRNELRHDNKFFKMLLGKWRKQEAEYLQEEKNGQKL